MADTINTRSLIIFALVQCVFVFLHIEQSGSYLRLLYLKQRNDKIRIELEEQKNIRMRDLERLINNAAIKADAISRGMAPIRLDQVKKISDLHEIILQSTH